MSDILVVCLIVIVAIFISFVAVGWTDSRQRSRTRDVVAKLEPIEHWLGETPEYREIYNILDRYSVDDVCQFYGVDVRGTDSVTRTERAVLVYAMVKLKELEGKI